MVRHMVAILLAPLLSSQLCGLLLQQKISTRHHCDSHTWQPLTVIYVRLCQYTISKSAFELLRCSLHLLFWGYLGLVDSWILRVNSTFPRVQESSRVTNPGMLTTFDHDVQIVTPSRCKVVLLGDSAAGKRPKIVSVTFETSSFGRIIKKPDITGLN